MTYNSAYLLVSNRWTYFRIIIPKVKWMLTGAASGVHSDHHIIFFFWVLQNALYDYRDSKSFWIGGSYFLLKLRSASSYGGGNLKVRSLPFHFILLKLSFAIVFGKENKNFTSVCFFFFSYHRENMIVFKKLEIWFGIFFFFISSVWSVFCLTMESLDHRRVACFKA